ncbi:MAG TPA: DUF4159 domain-containing protein, partial [Steroidobacteraceae bacterium]|nr:DUF4159 domain-containing protein [Steroidobacteraceae bacterium]
MKQSGSPNRLRLRPLLVLAALLAAAAGLALAQNAQRRAGGDSLPRQEFQIARLIDSLGHGGGRRPWWAIDYPEAEHHFTQGIRRLTRVDAASDSIHLRGNDPRLFDYPWLFAQQVGRWYLLQEEADGLREYLLRGGFLVADDFHGTYELEVFLESMRRVFPDHE